MRITEDNDGIESAADVVQSIIGTSFNFGSSGYDTNKTAEYTFTFDVVFNCSFRDDMKNHIRTDTAPGRMPFYGAPYEEIMEKIEAEYIDPATLIEEEEEEEEVPDTDTLNTDVPDDGGQSTSGGDGADGNTDATTGDD